MKIKSTSYFTNLEIPLKYCSKALHGGQNVSPQYSWDDYPGGVQSFVLIVVDRHPKASNFVHWLVVDIPSDINSIKEGASTSSKMPSTCIELMNSAGDRGWFGPEPPKGTGKHNYEATVYALDIDKTGLRGAVSEKDLLKKIKPNILSQATMTGLFGS